MLKNFSDLQVEYLPIANLTRTLAIHERIPGANCG